MWAFLAWGAVNKPPPVETQVQQMERRLDSLEQEVQTQRDSLEALAARYERRVLWLTRAIVSETNSVGEMKYVAWVIRNRVELQWRGKSTYKGVILDPWQFSAFNRGSGKRAYFMNMTSDNTPYGQRWKQARRIAREVITADRSEAPFSISTTHFYSPVSMTTAAPRWAWTLSEVKVASVDPHRFRFFDHKS